MAGEVTWVPVAGIWVRQSRPNLRGDEAAAYSARWQGAGSPAAYLADREATVWAELYRALAESTERTGGRDSARSPPGRRSLERVADLRTEAARDERSGCRGIRPTEQQWPAFQAVGAATRGRRGAGRAVHARRRGPRSLCLCVFEPGLRRARGRGRTGAAARAAAATARAAHLSRLGAAPLRAINTSARPTGGRSRI